MAGVTTSPPKQTRPELGGKLSAYTSWRHYFDVIIVGGAKPSFFTEKNPFIELDPATALVFHRREKLPLHSNGMRFTAFGAGGATIVEGPLGALDITGILEGGIFTARRSPKDAAGVTGGALLAAALRDSKARGAPPALRTSATTSAISGLSKAIATCEASKPRAALPGANFPRVRFVVARVLFLGVLVFAFAVAIRRLGSPFAGAA